MSSHFSIPDDVLVGLARAQRVSDGELAALKLALSQCKSKDIAKQLGISEAATRKRLGEVYRKFGIKGKGPGKLASLEQRLMAATESNADKSDAAGLVLAENSALTPFPVASQLVTQSASSLGLASQPREDKISLGSFQESFRYGLPDCPNLATQYCWNDAPALNLFQGRREVLATLKHWILSPADAHKLLAICGIGGIGKTSLARKLAEELDGYFEQVVWLTARKMQTPSELLRVLLDVLPAPDVDDGLLDRGLLPPTEVLSDVDSASPKTVQKLIKHLILCFSQQPCLVVIDGFETVFKGHEDNPATVDSQSTVAGATAADGSIPTFESSRQQQSSLYRDDLKAYKDWFEALRQPLGEIDSLSHLESEGRQLEKGAAVGLSCLILTSREKPKELLSIPEGDSHARLFTLDGLQDHEAARMLSQFRLRGQATDYKELVNRYYGHPMALRLAANAVKDLFYGRIRDFLDQEISVFDDLRSVLKTQFRRLSSAEIEVLYWLAINHVPCTLEGLQADVVSQDLKENLLYTLQSLERRFLVDVQHADGVSFELHPIVAEHVLNRFIREIFQDLIQGNLSLFNSHALMKADAEDSCREFQKTAIVQPILERLRNYFKSLFQVDEYLNSRLDTFRENNPYRLGYAGGNFVNLMVVLSQGKLSRKDFSKLTIWQAYLQGAQLREVNFTRCELNRSIFTETVSDVMSVVFNAEVLSSQATSLLACGDTRGTVHMWLTGTDFPGERLSDLLAPQAVGTAASVVGGQQSVQKMGQKCAEWSAHNGWVRSVVFLSGRACLLTGGDDSLLKLWQLPAFGQQSTGQMAGQPRLLWQTETADWVHAIALSPTETLTAAGGENRITLYDTNSGTAICQWLHDADLQQNLPQQRLQHLPQQNAEAQLYQSSQLTKQSSVRSLTFSPDGQQLASCGDDNIIRLWAIEAAAEQSVSVSLVAEFAGHTDWVRTVKFSAQGTHLLSSSDDGTVRIWPVEGEVADLPADFPADFPMVLRESSDRVRALALSSDGRWLASGGDDCQVRIWDLCAALKGASPSPQLVETVSTHRSRIWSVAFQRQGNRLMLAAGGDKQRLMLWQIHISERQQERQIETLISEALLLPADASALTTVNQRNSDHALNEKTDRVSIGVSARAVKTYRGYTNGIRAVEFLGERHLVSAGDNRDLSVWSCADGERKATFSMHQGRIWAIAVDPQNARIASASDDHTICLWDANTGQCLTTFAEHTSWVRTVAFSQRGRFLASSGDDCTIRIWNTASGFCLKVLKYSTHWIHSVCFDPTNSRRLVSGGDDRIVRCWDRKEGVSHSLAVHDHRICSVAYSPNGLLVASGSDDNTVILWDVAKGERLHRFRQPELGIKAVAFSPDNRYLAAGGEDQLVYLWDLQTPDKACFKLSFQSYSGVAGGIRSLAFSPDGRSIISGGLDETIRICNLSPLIELQEPVSSSSSQLPVFTSLIQPERPYEKIEIEGVKGLSHLQVSNLLSLGAVNRKDSLFL